MCAVGPKSLSAQALASARKLSLVGPRLWFELGQVGVQLDKLAQPVQLGPDGVLGTPGDVEPLDDLRADPAHSRLAKGIDPAFLSQVGVSGALLERFGGRSVEMGYVSSSPACRRWRRATRTTVSKRGGSARCSLISCSTNGPSVQRDFRSAGRKWWGRGSWPEL